MRPLRHSPRPASSMRSPRSILNWWARSNCPRSSQVLGPAPQAAGPDASGTLMADKPGFPEILSFGPTGYGDELAWGAPDFIEYRHPGLCARPHDRHRSAPCASLHGSPLTQRILVGYTTLVRAVPELILILILYYAGTCCAEPAAGIDGLRGARHQWIRRRSLRPGLRSGRLFHRGAARRHPGNPDWPDRGRPGLWHVVISRVSPHHAAGHAAFCAFRASPISGSSSPRTPR